MPGSRVGHCEQGRRNKEGVAPTRTGRCWDTDQQSLSRLGVRKLRKKMYRLAFICMRGEVKVSNQTYFHLLTL